jgi:uncharacterized protein (DUF58 family)
LAESILPRSKSEPSSGGLFALVERSIGLTISGLLLIALVVVGWLVAHIYGGRALYLLAYAGVIMVALAVYLARRRRPVTATRSDLARRARVGQLLDVELQLQSKSRVTTFRIEEQMHPALGPAVVVPIPALSPSQPISHSYSIRPKLRGVYKLGPLTAEFSDPMGLAKRRQQLLDAVEIIVHPNVEKVLDRPLTRAFEDPPLRPPKSRPWPQGFDFYGMRDYVRGDDLRRVVWRAFARTDRLLVREFEQGISDRVAIVVDTDENWHSPGDPSDTFETAVSAVASVGAQHIKGGFSIRLEAGYGQLGGIFRGPRSRLPFLDELARVHLAGAPLADAMERLVKSRRRDAHVVVVTSHFDARSAARANILMNDGASITVCAIVWEESDPVTIRRAHEIGAQVVQIKPGASMTGVFRASLMTNVRVH